jgi:HEAT repeat protein
MKTISAFVGMLLISLTLSETALAGSDLKKGPKKFSKNAIESLIMGLNSDNEGLIRGCAIMAGDYRISETVQHLAKILNSDVSYGVKTAAVFALYQIQNKEALAALKKACANNKCQFLKKSAEAFLTHYLICHPNEDVKLEEDYLVAE